MPAWPSYILRAGRVPVIQTTCGSTRASTSATRPSAIAGSNAPSTPAGDPSPSPSTIATPPAAPAPQALTPMLPPEGPEEVGAVAPSGRSAPPGRPGLQRAEPGVRQRVPGGERIARVVPHLAELGDPRLPGHAGHHRLVRAHAGQLVDAAEEAAADDRLVHERLADRDLPAGMHDGQPGAGPGAARRPVQPPG